MKNFVYFIAFVFVMLPLMLMADSVTLEWDANDTAPEGYKLYQRVDVDEYDYNNFIYQGTETTFTINDLGVKDQEITYYWVVRAYLGNDESDNSNEVSHVVNKIKPDVINDFTGFWNINTGTIDFAWKQLGTEPVLYWKIFVSDIQGGPYNEFDVIQNIGQVDLTSSKSIVVNNGEIKTFYFVIIGFKTDTIFSQNSNEVVVTIDKKSLVPVNNFRITVINTD